MYTLKKIVNIWDLVSFLNTNNIKPSNIVRLEKEGAIWSLLYYT